MSGRQTGLGGLGEWKDGEGESSTNTRTSESATSQIITFTGKE